MAKQLRTHLDISAPLFSGAARNFEEGHKLQKPSKKCGIFQSPSNISFHANQYAK